MEGRQWNIDWPRVNNSINIMTAYKQQEPGSIPSAPQLAVTALGSGHQVKEAYNQTSFQHIKSSTFFNIKMNLVPHVLQCPSYEQVHPQRIVFTSLLGQTAIGKYVFPMCIRETYFFKPV